jgi:hypothetical protein
VIAEIEELEEAEEVRKILVKEEEPIYCLFQDNSQARHLSSIILPRTQPQAITGMQPITITPILTHMSLRYFSWAKTCALGCYLTPLPVLRLESEPSQS